MRFLLLFAALGFMILAFRLPQTSASTARAVVLPREREVVRSVMHQVERATALGDVEECNTLSPIPLYAGSPGGDDWETFCSALVQRDASLCGRIAATLTPDLQGFCTSVFISHT